MRNSKRQTRPQGSGKVHQTWGIFVQSDGMLLDTARSRIGAYSKLRKLAKGMPVGYAYVDSIIVP